MKTCSIIRLIAVAALALAGTTCYAQDAGATQDNGTQGTGTGTGGDNTGGGNAAVKAVDAMCPDSGVLSGRLFTDICWDCSWPLYIAGVQQGKKGRFTPWGFSPQSTCSCSTKDPLKPALGYGQQFWAPARVFETTKIAYCSPFFGGVMLSDKVANLAGGPDVSPDQSSGETFYNVHEYAFPIFQMLQILPQTGCHQEYSDLDILQMSELHPDHNDDELSFALNFMSVIFTNPAAQLFGIGEGIATSASFGLIPPVDGVLTAGTWGDMLPFTGNYSGSPRPAQTSNLLALRFLAKLHWMGLERRTAGSDAMCKAQYNPMIKKSQYRWSQMYPVPEAKGWHWSGETAFNWGEFRQRPVVGEDFDWLLWRWNDCCVTGK